MGRLIIVICAFIGALVLARSCAPTEANNTALYFAGRTVSWAMLAAVVVAVFALRKGRG